MGSSDDNHENDKKRKREEIEPEIEPEIEVVSDEEEVGNLFHGLGVDVDEAEFHGLGGDVEGLDLSHGLGGDGYEAEFQGVLGEYSFDEEGNNANIGALSFGDELLGDEKLFAEDDLFSHGLLETEVKQQEEENMNGILSTVPFYTLNFTSLTREAIYRMGFYQMTQIQAGCIPALLHGKNVVGAASSGSGKTLAYLIPAIELLHSSGFDVSDGTGVIIICPTTELAVQTYEVAQRLLRYSSMTVGIALDGRPRKEEATSVSGSNLLVATPGRLLRHLRRTKEFMYKNLKFLVVDEADRLLEAIFEKEIDQIIKLLPKERQTALFSDTLINKVEDLARLSFKTLPVYIDVDEGRSMPTVKGLKQSFCIVPSEMRFLMLYSFLKRNLSKKVMVIFSSCAAVKYYSKLLRYIHVDCFSMHGKQQAQIRWSNFEGFCRAEKGVLLCTGVSARGLDIPAVEWVVQYDASDDLKEYLRRVGRTARGEVGKRHALLFLTLQEMPFIKHLLAAKVTLEEYEFDGKELANLQHHLEDIVDKESHLRRLAKKAYESYLYAYKSMKDPFNFRLLNLKDVAASFCLCSP